MLDKYQIEKRKKTNAKVEKKNHVQVLNWTPNKSKYQLQKISNLNTKFEYQIEKKKKKVLIQN